MLHQVCYCSCGHVRQGAKIPHILLLSALFNQSVTMASVVETILYLSFLWTCQVLTLVFLQLIKEYLKAKPLGSQTLLDKTYLHLFSSYQVVVVFRIGFTTVYHLEINVDDPWSSVLGWMIHFVLDNFMFGMLTTTLTSITSVYSPSALDIITEQTFCIGLWASTFLAAAASTLTAWGLDWCNLAFHYLRQSQSDSCLPITPIRLTVVVIGIALTAGFKVSLMCYRNILTEGERNLLSSKVILILSFPIAAIKIINTIFPSYSAYVVLVGMTLYSPFFPLTVLCVSENVRRFVWRRVCNVLNISFAPPNRTQNFVTPDNSPTDVQVENR